MMRIHEEAVWADKELADRTAAFERARIELSRAETAVETLSREVRKMKSESESAEADSSKKRSLLEKAFDRVNEAESDLHRARAKQAGNQVANAEKALINAMGRLKMAELDSAKSTENYRVVQERYHVQQSILEKRVAEVSALRNQVRATKQSVDEAKDLLDAKKKVARKAESRVEESVNLLRKAFDEQVDDWNPYPSPLRAAGH